jgi:zinc/manganese transport system substrate-binding protein
LQLEVGWLPALITGSRNGKILTGALGNLDCSTLVKVLEVPTKRISRSQGDLHPGGNPHYWTDPRNGVRIAYGLYKRLAKLDPAHAAYYKKRYKKYALKLIRRMRKWRKQLKPYRGSYMIPYHQSWIYFLKFSGLKRLGTIERLPGVKPSAAHLANLYRRIKTTKGRMVVVAESFYPKKTAKTISRKFNVKFVTLAQLTGGVRGASTYIKTIDYNVRTVINALKGSKR